MYETWKRIDRQQTINAGILNAFFVQYHLAIGKTPYVERGVGKELENK